MNADLSLSDVLALVEIVDEHVERNFPGVEPPRVIREIQHTLMAVLEENRKEIQSALKKQKKQVRRPLKKKRSGGVKKRLSD